MFLLLCLSEIQRTLGKKLNFMTNTKEVTKLCCIFSTMTFDSALVSQLIIFLNH